MSAAAADAGRALVVRGAKVLTLDRARPVIDDGAVLVVGERIEAVGVFDTIAAHAPAGATVVGGPDAWVLPAFVNAHYHAWRTQAMGASEDLPLERFLLRLSQFEIPADLDAPEARGDTSFTWLTTLVGAIQLLRSGVAVTIDMALGDRHDAAIDAYETLGLGCVYAPTARTRNGYVYGDDADFLATLPDTLRAAVLREGGLGLTGAYVDPDAYVTDWRRLHRAAADRGRGTVLAVAPDGPEWVTADQLRRLSRLAREHGAPLHLHNSESPMEMQWARHTHATTMTAYLDDLGVLGPEVSCGHGVWYSDDDAARLAAAGATTVHCPSSNLRLSNGIAPIARYRAAGLRVAIGTDGQGFADDSDFLAELRLAGLLTRTPGMDTDALDAWSLFEMATVHGAEAFGMAHTGRVVPGATAHLAVLDGTALRRPFHTPHADPYATVLARASATHVTDMVVAGRVLLERGRLTTVDEGRVGDATRALYERLWHAQRPARRAVIDALEPHVVDWFARWRDLGVAPHTVWNRR
jgi:cytosine/adenosine deaminase-related metal-dependent hydrolase